MTESSTPPTDPMDRAPEELPVLEPAPLAEHREAKPVRATLRPPDWTAPNSVSSLALERLLQSRATPRRTGSRADLSALRARLHEVREQGDAESEKNLSAQLAKKLVSRGTRLKEATKLARRSLLLAEDPELREELSSWFAGLGEVALAAGTLEPLTERLGDDVARAATWMRIAVLRGRAGDAIGAAKAMWSAAEADRSDPVPLELFAALRPYADSAMSPARAARALLEAARRRKARNDDRGAHNDLLQAYEADPAYLPATEQLADSLFQTGRFQAADEVWRLGARVHPEPQPIHVRRLRDALGGSDVALALGAALDASADTTLDLDGIRTATTLVNDGAGSVPVPNFDGLLGPAGLLPLLAARLELAARQRSEPKALLALSRLVAGALGNPAQAAKHLIDALVLGPANEEAWSALREYAQATGDRRLLIDACLRVVSDAEPSPPQPGESGEKRVVDREVLELRLADLAREASHDLSDVHIALWALGRYAELGPLPPDLAELAMRLSGYESPVPRFESWSQLSLAELRRAVDALEGRPAAAEAYVEALLEIARRDPSEARFAQAIERVLLRLSATERLERFWREAIEQGVDQTAPRLGLCRLYIAQGRNQDALELLRAAQGRPLGFEEAALFSAIASLYGNAEDRALGLSKLADHARAPVRAILLSVASGIVLDEGKTERALRFAEDACHSAPTSARPIVSYAQASLGQHTRVAALSFQRAAEVAVPRVDWCRALTDAHDDPKLVELALRRWLSLSPLDPEASQRLLLQLAKARDAEQLAKTMDWLIGQPVALGYLFDELAEGVHCVLGQNPLAAKALCQRLLGVFGARDERINTLIAEVARQIGEPWLLVALLERGLAMSTGDVAQSFIQLSDARAELGHTDLAYDALLQAMEAGARVDEVLPRLGKLGEPETSDGVLSQLSAWALVQERVKPDDAAEAHRDLGAALWDLAGDSANAVQAWHRAAELDPEHGDERLARDLIAFCGYQAALPELFSLAARRPSARAAGLLIAAAALALNDGFKAEATQLAFKGLELAAERTDALAIIERAVALENTEALERAYRIAESSLLGIYGERALHYRAARQFERRRQHDAAFRHAVVAFEAVPAQGVAFALMLRLAPLVGQEAEAARAIERVAQAQTDPARRATWLEQAARAAGAGPEGTRLRVEVLMRALLVRPEVESLEALGVALTELFRDVPEERPKFQALFDSSTRTLLRRLDDAELVSVAITAAKLAANVFSSAGLTAGALRRALQLNPASPAFEGAGQFRTVLGSKPGSTRPLLDELSEACTKSPLPHRALLELGAELAERNASDLWPQFVVAIARSAPDDPAAIARAEGVCLEHPHLLEELKGIIDISDRVSGMFERAERLAANEPEHATRMLEDLLKQPDLREEVYERALAHLEQLHSSRRKFDALEKLLTTVIETSRLGTPLRVGAARRLANVLSARNAHSAALDVFGVIDKLDGTTEEDLVQAASLAREAGDGVREHELRTRLLGMRTLDTARLAELGRLMQLASELGQTQRAVEWAQQALALQPSFDAATELLVKDAERREDWTRYVELASSRLNAASGPTEKDLFALSDVMRFKQKQPHRAAELLAQFAGALPKSVKLLDRLAECWLEASNPASAAEAYARASRTVKDSASVARYTELSARQFLIAGDVEQASQLVRSDSLYPKTPAILELRVEIAGKKGDRKAQAAALEELAASSMAPPKERAELLRRASELALEEGDTELATTRAQRAARIAPSDPKVQVFARLLEYKRRGSGSSQDALATITELRSLGRIEDVRLAGLRGFLLAEALAKRLGSPAAMKELREVEAEWPGHPLIALGLAEHLKEGGSKEEVLSHYKRALDESVQVVRPLEEVALAAAAYAEAQGASGSAIELLEPLGSRSDRIRQTLARLRTLPTARTRLDLPIAKEETKAPEFFASVPPGSNARASAPQNSVPEVSSVAPSSKGLEQARAPVRSLADRSPQSVGRTSRPLFRKPPSSDQTSAQRPNPAQLAATPPYGVQSHSSGAKSPRGPASSPAEFESPPSTSPPDTELDEPIDVPIEVTFEPPIATPLAQVAAAQHAPVPPSRERIGADTTTASLPEAVPDDGAPAGFATGTALPQGTPPAKPLVTTLEWSKAPPKPKLPGEHRAVAAPEARARLDRTVEIPSFDVPKEKPVRVEVKADARTLGQTWNSAVTSQPTPPRGSSETGVRETQVSEGHLPEGVVSLGSDVQGSFGPPPKPRTDGPAVGKLSATSMSFPAVSPEERDLQQALRAGSVEAGRALIGLLQAQPGRSHDIANAWRALVQLQPGELPSIERLVEAALGDRDLAYAAALRHCTCTFSAPAQAPAAPPLQHQTEQPEVLTRLLCGSPPTPALEALALLCRNVPQLFRQQESLEGARRVSLDAPLPLSQLAASLHRLLGTHRTVILERPSPQPVTFRLLLGDPITLLIEGQGNPLTAEYRHYFGATLFGSRPELALSCGLPRERLQMVFDAILAAFGPPKQLKGDVARVAQLAERLWESVPAREQRRLQELCEQPEYVTLERALSAAQSAWVRAGLFASGDLGIAARDASRLVGVEPLTLYQPGELARACRNHEILAELLRFATSSEYATLRWTEPRSLSSILGQA